ncbi:lysophospholipase D GDPD3a isoform X1 [Synchiropus splendidus]|uniref:lysophospholipase D GDPD3a isoform X1 n=1 Tax=Synchiropus splendidus TaxID=270530 RepID=UPI00237E183D|nr:lysophospholipase D GDPD3a isoform X1 [Synchiropus splendidus]
MSVALWCYLLPALAGYALTSIYLLRNPELLHRRKRPAFHCRHISHRGGKASSPPSTALTDVSALASPGCGEKLENTMEAFTNAVDHGAEMLEMDCQLTLDGHVVVSHDDHLLRQTGLDSRVSSLRLQDLPLYRQELEVTFNQGHYSRGADRKLPLLEEVFQRFPKIPVSIEIKENNQRLIEKVSELVTRYRRERITVWASVSSRAMQQCHSTNSAMPYSFTAKRGVLLLLLFYSGLLPFVPLGETLLQFYLPRIFNRTFVPEKPILRKRLAAWLLEKVTMRRSLFRHLAARGIQVHLFVCNTEQDIKAAVDLGATGVMSDYPSLLSGCLASSPAT